MGRQTRQARRARLLRPKSSVGEGPSLEFPPLSNRLSGWLEQLGDLPPDAPEWDEMPIFAASMMHVHAEKLAERTVALEEALDERIAAMTQRFSDELGYLEIDISTWPVDAAERPWIVPQAHELALGLEAVLEHYSEVRPQAPTQSQEQQRAPVRAEREEAVTSTIAQWDELMSQPSAFPLSMPSLNEAIEHPVVSAAEYAALQERANKLEQKYQKAQSALEKRTKERDHARAEARYLRSQTAKPEPQPKQAVLPGEAHTKPQTDSATLEEAQVGSVSEAIAAAKANFPETLTIALNSASNEGTPYKRPNEVYAALKWLATEYSDTRLNPPGTDPEFDRRLKEACPGWFYSPKQSDTAKNMFKGEYEATLESHTYTLDQHIGRGTRGDPQHMIRIAFDWDSERQQVIVGYIGPHQRTQAS